ncbi:MAG: hypothetical protein ACYDAO_00805 [Thermoplasmataceae archaeon]
MIIKQKSLVNNIDNSKLTSIQTTELRKKGKVISEKPKKLGGGLHA